MGMRGSKGSYGAGVANAVGACVDCPLFWAGCTASGGSAFGVFAVDASGAAAAVLVAAFFTTPLNVHSLPARNVAPLVWTE
jgi:hypothetical protein